MELELTDEQTMLRDTTRRFLEDSMPLSAVRELAENEPAGFDRAWWRQAAELGWTSMLVPEELGGGSVSGAGLADLAMIAHERGRLVSPGPLLGTNVVAAALAAAGAPGEQAAVLEGLLAGEVVATWAFAEPNAEWSAAGVALTATPTAEGVVLDGVKTTVEAGAEGDQVLVTARTGAGLTQVLVPAGSPGVEVERMESLDLVRRLAEIRFTGVELPANAVVGEIGGAAADVERQLQLALVLQCAEIVGAIDRAFAFTVEWAFDRYSFGRPLASYQALKHRFAEMKLWLEASHATADAAVRAVEEAAANAAELVSVAKSYIGDQAPALLQGCVQMHGGIGVTWEHDLHLYLRRVTQNALLFGTPEDHRERIVALLGV